MACRRTPLEMDQGAKEKGWTCSYPPANFGRPEAAVLAIFEVILMATDHLPDESTWENDTGSVKVRLLPELDRHLKHKER
jgi:hypothetical protein